MISISKLYCGAAGLGDALRYRPNAGRGGKPVVVWNCTRRCNLRCAHCYSQSDDGEHTGEMTTAQATAMLEDLAEFGVPVVLFSGGEPLMREDVLDLTARAVGLGMRAVLSSNGTLITPPVARRIAESHVSYVGISLDGMRATNDEFRGRAGAFDDALAGIRNCRDVGIKVGLRFTITRRNADEIADVFSLVRDEGLPRACFYHLVGVGRAGGLADGNLDHAATRRAVDLIIDRTAQLNAAGPAVEVLTADNHADGPYVYLRMLREANPRAAEVLELLRASGGNASGDRIGCVSWDGEVHADQFWRDVSFGNVTQPGRAFSRIWTDLSNPLLAGLKDKLPHLKGRCSACRFANLCGGNLRARAMAATGDPWAPDPACYLTDEEIAEGSGNDERD